ncbi:hypothetical protein CPB97_003393, partial [Podila verticillata]
PDKPKYSVLILGQTQSGKTALIEHIKKYADPAYSIDTSLLGNGNGSGTLSTQLFRVESNLPVYEVYRKDTGEIINLEELPRKYDVEDNYLELLASRESDIGMRLAPHDANTPSEVMEFQFLDTPGMNDTNYRDMEFAADILNEIMATRVFNLILIVISTKTSLSMEFGFSLEYYSKVLEGLHSNIAFLYTHVDYLDKHPSNTSHQSRMAVRHRAFCDIFRERQYSPARSLEDSTNAEDVGLYKHFTIDLTSKKRPIIQCLIRNTLREILQLAVSNPPEVLDTTTSNIDRINAIVHPDSANQAYRDQFKASLSARVEDSRNYEELFMDEYTSGDEQDVEDLGQINILLIGDFRSGKTSLVEMFKLYADPAYNPIADDIGEREGDITDARVKITSFITDLHTVQIRKLGEYDDGHDVVHMDEEAKQLSDVFEELLNLGPHKAKITIASSGGKRYQFNIFEGPGLNESADSFEKNIFSIYRTLIESDLKFHQVLFTLDLGPITSDIIATIRACSDVFSDLCPLFSFVNINIDYSMLHIRNNDFQDCMNERQELLRQCIQPAAIAYLIDCDFQGNWPVRRGKTYNVVHDILQAATKQRPIALKSPLMKKTPRMVLIDYKLKWHARNAFQATRKEIDQNNKDILMLHDKIRQLGADSRAKDLAIDSTECNEDVTLCDDMTLLQQQEELEVGLNMAKARFVQLEKAQLRYNLLRYWIFREALPKSMMEALLRARVYETQETPFDEIKEIYQEFQVNLEEDPYAEGADPHSTVGLDSMDGYSREASLSKRCSILMFGKTQAGKSTFIEFVKTYTDKEHKIDRSLLGTGIHSKTVKPTRLEVSSNLPAYMVVDSKQEKIDIDALSRKFDDPDDYVDALKDNSTVLKLATHGTDAPLSNNVEITFLDTPGIEDTYGRDTEHAPKIIDEMAKMRTFNLIVIIVNCKEPASKSHQLAFDYYSKVIQVLQGCHSNIIFVYTHVKYEDCHHSNIEFNTNLEVRHRAFSRLFRGQGHKSVQGSFNRDKIQDGKVDLYPKYTIDMDERQRPVVRCMLLKTLREILQRAVKSPSIPLDTIMRNLIRIYGISHPDEMNRLQQRKVMTPMQAILNEKHQGSDNTLPNGDVNGEDEDDDGYLSDHFC